MKTSRFYTCAPLDSSKLLRHTVGMADKKDWARLANYVIRRRVELGYPTRQAFALAINVTATTLGALERDHRSVSDNTLEAIGIGLRWAPGAAGEILAGGEPTYDLAAEVLVEDDEHALTLQRRLAALVAARAAVDAEIAELDGELEARNARRAR